MRVISKPDTMVSSQNRGRSPGRTLLSRSGTSTGPLRREDSPVPACVRSQRAAVLSRRHCGAGPGAGLSGRPEPAPGKAATGGRRQAGSGALGALRHRRAGGGWGPRQVGHHTLLDPMKSLSDGHRVQGRGPVSCPHADGAAAGGGGGDTSLPAQGASSVLSRKGSSARYVRGADRRYTTGGTRSAAVRCR